MKKIAKSFCTSFLLSLSAIYVADTMFFSPSIPAKKEIKLPQTNIALFLEKTNSQLPPQATKKVAGGKLKNLAKTQIIMPVPKEPEEIELSYLSKEENNYSEEVALVPLEETKTQLQEEKLADNNIISPPLAKKDIPVVEKLEVALNAENTADKNPIAEKTIAAHEEPSADKMDIAESDMIPIENGGFALAKTKVKIADDAPKTQIAMIGNVSAISDDNNTLKVLPEDEKEEKEWHSMDESPWVVAKSNQFAKNNKVVEDFSSQKTEEEISELLEPQKLQEGETVQTAQVAKNILIPIPEDILNDENLTPQLVSPKKKMEKDPAEDIEEENSSKKGSFLKNITSIFSSKKEDAEEAPSSGNTTVKKKNKKNKKSSVKILPAEMKLSFQPGRAQISGQTLRWIQAFALKATEEPDVILEIRIDKNSSYALQQRRLELLHTILGSKGIDENKVSTVFTSREPNSFIIRTLRIGDDIQNTPAARQQNKQPVYQTW